MTSAATSLKWKMEQHHRGKRNAIKQETIAEYMGIPSREIRTLTLELLDAGFVICASVDGIYVPDGASEARHYLATLKAHALSELERMSKVQKALVEIYGNEVQNELFSEMVR